MAFKMSLDLKDVMCNALINPLSGTDGTAGTASLLIYSGSQPASADDEVGTANTLLCQIDNIGWSLTTSGTAGLASTAYQGTAATSGTAGWARIETVGTYGTCRVDGDVGTSLGNVFTINVNNFTSGGLVTLVSANIYMA